MDDDTDSAACSCALGVAVDPWQPGCFMQSGAGDSSSARTRRVERAAARALPGAGDERAVAGMKTRLPLRRATSLFMFIFMIISTMFPRAASLHACDVEQRTNRWRRSHRLALLNRYVTHRVACWDLAWGTRTASSTFIRFRDARRRRRAVPVRSSYPTVHSI